MCFPGPRATDSSSTGMSYKDDATLEVRFSRTIRAILGLQFFTRDTWADQQEGTDFAIFRADPIRVAVRLRRHKYFLRYPNDITVRWSRPSGADTEIHKISKGLVDAMLYGFVSPNEDKIISYCIIGLSIFPKDPIAVHTNNPADSELAVYRRSQFDVLKIYP